MKLDSEVNISVVIATRNRPEHLAVAVRSLEAQSILPREIIVVDASDDAKEHKLAQVVPLKWIFSQPSVCKQRNAGIRAAVSDWIFLCDDDIELEKNYFEKLVDYVKTNRSCGAMAGLLLQKENDEWAKNYPVKSFPDLLWRFTFQHSIWGDIQVKSPWLVKPIWKFVIGFYNRRGNSFSLAGWPLITNWQESVVKTKFFSLGADLIRKDWLLQSPFDESLEPHGIGDNYGVAQNFPGEFPIHIITSTAAYHHRATTNRADEGRIKYLRIVALHYFLTKQRSSLKIKLFFVWSVFGHCVFSLIRDRKNFAHIVKAFFDVILKRNPYLNSKVAIT